MEFVHAAKVEGLPKIVSIQNNYSLLSRCRFEGNWSLFSYNSRWKSKTKPFLIRHLLPLFTTFSAASNINFRIEDPVISLQLFYLLLITLGIFVDTEPNSLSRVISCLCSSRTRLPVLIDVCWPLLSAICAKYFFLYCFS